MLVAKNIMAHVAGPEEKKNAGLGSFQIALFLLMGLYVILAIPSI